MFKNMTISGKTNLITEILAVVVWLIAVASAGLDRLIVGVFSFPLLILVPICGWLLMPISKKILKNGEIKIGWRKMLWYAGMFMANLVIAVLAATAVLAGGAALINMTDGGGIDEIGSALVLVFAAWMSAFSVMILTMLPQVQMVIMLVLEKRQEKVRFEEAFRCGLQLGNTKKTNKVILQKIQKIQEKRVLKIKPVNA